MVGRTCPVIWMIHKGLCTSEKKKKKKKVSIFFPSCINFPSPHPKPALILVNYIDSNISQETASMVENTD